MISEPFPAWVDIILQSKKYKDLGIPRNTILNLLAQPEAFRLGEREVKKWLRQKLHNIVAAYLGDPDYKSESQEMEKVFSSKDRNSQTDFCRKILKSHSSTRERMEYLDIFYRKLFEITGRPQSISDLACGLNPFAFPWMGLDSSIQYHAYDLHLPRVEFINHFFNSLHMAPLAEHRDILVEPPVISTDVAFLFKEAHRLDQRQKGCNKVLWPKIETRWLLVSLPSQSLSGKHDLVRKQRDLVYASIGDFSWSTIELDFGNEMVFCIDKHSKNSVSLK
jgi:16S rRNA (guanine(1405)-N(7))-methyltransferase